MAAHARPIRHTLMTVILLTCGAVMLITSAAFIAYEYVTFRQLMVRNVKILGEAIAANSTAAIASPRNLTLRSEEHTSELQSRENLVCRLLLEKKLT